MGLSNLVKRFKFNFFFGLPAVDVTPEERERTAASLDALEAKLDVHLPPKLLTGPRSAGADAAASAGVGTVTNQAADVGSVALTQSRPAAGPARAEPHC